MKFSKLVDSLAQLEATSKRLEMTAILGKLFADADEQDVAPIVYLSQERLAAAFEPIEFGIGEALAADALAKASGKDKDDIRKLYKLKGDYGEVAETLLKGKGGKLTVAEVYAALKDIATTSGGGTVEKKTSALAALLKQMNGQEARYLLRIPLGRLRLGVGDVTVLDGLSWSVAGDKSLRPPLERGYNVCSDLGYVAHEFKKGGIDAVKKIKVRVGAPVRMALAERAKSPEDIILRMGRCALEPKLDGFRCQVHKNGDKVRIFSRNLEETTGMFPDIAEGIAKQVQAKSAILEGEAIAYDPATLEFLPFQETTTRRRKYGIEEKRSSLPLKLMAFDLLFVDGKDVTHETYEERRARLKQAIKGQDTIQVIDNVVTGDTKEVEKFFLSTVENGQEGMMAKKLDSIYQAGARNFNWIKLKRSYQGHLSDTVDVVIVGYLRGRGMRAKFGIGAMLGAVYDKPKDRFRTVGKVGSGWKDEEWSRWRELLDAIAVSHMHARVDSLMVPDVWVEPKYVVEVRADEITKSPIHTAGKRNDEPGYALRFPRAVSFMRTDKKPEDATTEKEIVEMYEKQGKTKTE